MRDMGDNNGGKLSYDGKSFQVTDEIGVMFGAMGKSKERLFGSSGLR